MIDGIAARLASVESKTSQPASVAPDPAAAARVEALEKSVASLRDDVASLRTQSEKLASDVKDFKSAPRDAAAAPDLAAINERITGLERATRAQGTESRRRVQNRPMMWRFAASSRPRCSMFSSASAIPTRPR